MEAYMDNEKEDHAPCS